MARIHRVPISWNLGRYRTCAVVILYALTAPHVRGFGTDSHAAITEYALQALTAPNSMPRVTWSARAIREIRDANLCLDMGDEKGAPNPNEPGPCVPAKITFCRDCHLTHPEWHLDGERIKEGSAWLRENRDAFVTYVKQGRFTEARKVLGFALHTLQDFYAHSNWVDLGNEETFDELLTLDSYGPPYSTRHPAISHPEVDPKKIPLCGTTERWTAGYRIVSYTLYAPWARAPNLSEMIEQDIDLRVLTTGYFFGIPPFHFLQDDPTPDGKCAHSHRKNGVGTIIGIDKDDSSRNGSMSAYGLARGHSIKFIQDVLNQLDRPETLEELYNPRAPGDPIVVPAVSRTRFGSVNQGDVYEFRANPGGEDLKIVWGRTGLFGLGNPIYCGPEGTPGVNPSNHSLWVTPPLPEANVGALIGSIYPAECTPGGQEPCNAIESFLIGRGVRRPMPASGQLFLLVNDGVLTNNSGHFKVAVSAVRGESRPIAQVRAGGR